MTPTELEGIWFEGSHFPVRIEANLAAAQYQLEEAGHGFLPRARRRELDACGLMVAHHPSLILRRCFDARSTE
jgi:hypothetical protein